MDNLLDIPQILLGVLPPDEHVRALATVAGIAGSITILVLTRRGKTDLGNRPGTCLLILIAFACSASIAGTIYVHQPPTGAPPDVKPLIGGLWMTEHAAFTQARLDNVSTVIEWGNGWNEPDRIWPREAQALTRVLLGLLMAGWISFGLLFIGGAPFNLFMSWLEERDKKSRSR